MEQFPQGNEQNQPERLQFESDLNSDNSHWFSNANTAPHSSFQETAQEAYEELYLELSRVTDRVFKKLKGYHDHPGAKNWAEVGDLGHILETMNEIDEFLGG